MLLSIVYIIGITAEAMTGALSAGRQNMDWFGVMLIASVTAIYNTPGKLDQKIVANKIEYPLEKEVYLMTKVRKRHNAEFKSKVAVEAIKEHKTLNELTAEYGVHATQISNWKKQALAVIPTAFNTKQQANEQAQQAIIDELHRQLGQVISERDWLKKKSLQLP